MSEWSEPRQNPCVCFPQLAKKIREKFNRYLDVVNRNKQVVEASYTAHLTSPLTAIQDCCSIPASMMEWVTPTVSYKCLSRMLMVTMKAPVLLSWLIPVRSSERQLLANTTSFPSLEMIWLVLISNDCVYMTSSTAVLRTPCSDAFVLQKLFICLRLCLWWPSKSTIMSFMGLSVREDWSWWETFRGFWFLNVIWCNPRGGPHMGAFVCAIKHGIDDGSKLVGTSSLKLLSEF